MDGEEKVRLFVSEIPKGFGLFPLKLAIGEAVGNKDALLSIEFVRREDGTRVEGVSEILLQNAEYAETLTDNGLVIKHRSQNHVLHISDHLSDKSGDEQDPTNERQQPESFEEERSNDVRSRPRSAPKERPKPAPRRTAPTHHHQQEEDEVQRLQRRIECRNVPQHLFHKRDMFEHFQQFGNIEDLFIPNYLEPTRKPFVKVKYETHESARRAMLEGGELPGFGHTMYIDWDATEASQVRHRLGKEPTHNRPREKAHHSGTSTERPSTSHEYTSQQQRTAKPNSKFKPQKGRGARESTSRERFDGAARKQPSPVNKPKAAWNDEDDHEKVYDWFDILQENRDLFDENAYDERCVLLQTIRTGISDEVKEYFRENYSVDIEHVYLMPDGLLLVLESKEDADMVLNEKSVKILDEKMNVVAKPIPMMYGDRILLEGSFDDNSAVQELLECCDISDDVTYDVVKLENSSFQVTFSEDVDVENILDEIKNADLEDYNPKAYAMCHTDCVRVEDLVKSARNDAVKLVFQNKKKGGGKVTKVERYGGTSSAIVYFANYRDAERIADKEYGEVEVKNKPVRVELYFRNIVEAGDESDESDDSDDSFVQEPRGGRRGKQQERARKNRRDYDDSDDFDTRPRSGKAAGRRNDRRTSRDDESRDFDEGRRKKAAPKPNKRFQRKRTLVKEFRTTPNVEGDVIKYVRKSKKGFDKLHEDLEGICELEVAERPTSVSFCFRPATEDLDDSLKYNQEEYEKACNTVVDDFFIDFVTKSATYESDNLMALRNAMNWNEDHEFLKIECNKGNAVEVYVRWCAQNQGQVMVTGKANDVTTVLQYIKRKCDVTESSMPVPLSSYRALRECDVISRIDKDLHNEVEIRPEGNAEENIWRIRFKGPRTNVDEARTKMSSAMMELTTRTVSDMGSRTEYLLSALKSDRDGLQPGAVDVRQVIQGEFENQHIHASLQLKLDEVCLVYCDPSELDKARQALTEIVEQSTIEVKEGFQEVVNTQEWRRLKQNVSSSGAVQVYVNVPKSSIDVVGLTQAFRKAFDDVRTYVGENVVVTRSLHERSFVIKFLRDNMERHKDSKKRLKDVNLAYTPEDGAVTVKGKIRKVTDAMNWLEEATSDLAVVEKSIQDPGMPEYFRSKKGRENIVTIALRNHCRGVIDAEDEPTATFRQSSSEGAKVSGKIPGTNVRVSLIESDITTVDFEAIVNASNSQLELRSGGVSGAIRKKGGWAIQKEMQQVREQIGGKLEKGQAVSTGAGSLPFKRIIHAVGPTWYEDHNSTCVKDLRNCVRSCLREASNHNLRSVALPAISCGIFGGKASICAPIIVKAIEDFAAYNEDTSLRQIGLVEMSNKEIVKEFEKAMKHFATGGKAQEEKSRRKPVPRARSSFQQQVEERGNQLNLNVTVGDISTFQADVIVTSTTAQNLANCQGSAISKALLKQAGSSLKAACQKAASSHPGLTLGDVIATPGFNLSCREVYHVIFDRYNPYNGAHLLKSAIKSCLDKADNKGYSSIAFPALGAGGFQFPPAEVVKIFDEVVRNYARSNLQTVNLVIWSGDNATIAAAQAELPSNFTQAPAASAAPATSGSGGYANVKVFVKQGDITSTRSSAIVNSTNQFSLDGQVGKALVAKAGQGIIQECANNPLSQTNRMRVTSGGNLCKYILHLDTPKDATQLETVLVDCFSEADRLGVSTLAIPPVGTGGIGLSSQVVSKAMASALGKFDKSNPGNLKQIKVYIYQGNMLPEFQKEIFSQPAAAAQSQGVLGKMKSAGTAVLTAFGLGGTSKPAPKPKMPSRLPRKGTAFESEVVRILFCAWKKTEVEKAFDAVQEIIDEMSITKVLTNEAVDNLTPEDEQDLLDVMKRLGVLIEKTSNDKLTIKGLRASVFDAYGQANDIIHQFKQAYHIAEYVLWMYMDINDSQMKDFPLKANYELENEFKRNERGKATVSLGKDGGKCTVDFAKMEASMGGASVKVSRNTSSSVDTPLPQYWEDMGGQICKRVKVAANTPEYQTVLQKFNASMQFNVVTLERIQNQTLWNQFQAQKTKIESKMSSQQVTKDLFHGTDKDTCDKILNNGFDRSYAGKNATAFGKGVYFATTAKYSHGYTAPDQQNLRCMFLAEVITGVYCVGNAQTTVAPMQSDGSPFDSVVNNQGNPTIYVVFRDSSVYPSYLLTFR